MIKLNKEEDARLEELAQKHGMRWDGDRWVIEDASFHPFMRAMLKANKMVDRSVIRRIFLTHGFTIKEGQADLKPYVYEAAEALLRELSQVVVVPDYLIAELESCATIMSYIGAADAEDIESDNVEVIGEDEQGRDAYADVSIVEWAERTATLLNKIAGLIDRKKLLQGVAYDKERERAAFEKHYAQDWQKFSKNAAAHSIDFLCSELKAMRRGNEYGKDQPYINFMWKGWQAKAESAGRT